MNDSDKANFKELFDGLADYYRQDRLGKLPMQIYFGALQKFSFESVSQAASAHLADTKSGQYFPKAADLIKHVEGGEITADMIIAAAKLGDTPLGLLAHIHIGSWDLNNQDAFYLRQRAAECLQLLPQWKAKAAAGEYSDHEISVMLKYDVSPAAPFAFGLAAPANAQALIERAAEIKQSPRHLKFIEPPHDQSESYKSATMHPEMQKKLAKLVDKVNP